MEQSEKELIRLLNRIEEWQILSKINSFLVGNCQKREKKLYKSNKKKKKHTVKST